MLSFLCLYTAARLGCGQIDSKFFVMNQMIMLKRKLSQTAQDLVNMKVTVARDES